MYSSSDLPALCGFLAKGAITVATESSSMGLLLTVSAASKILEKAAPDLAEHVFVAFEYEKFKELLIKTHPNDLNHDLDKLIKRAMLRAVGFMKRMYVEEQEADLSLLQKLRNPFEPIKTVLDNFSKDLKAQFDSETFKKEELESYLAGESAHCFERLINYLFSLANVDESHEEIVKLREYMEANLPVMFDLAYKEELKNKENDRAFKAFQIWALEEANKQQREVLLGQGKSLEFSKKILEEIEILKSGKSSSFENQLKEGFEDQISEIKKAVNAEFKRVFPYLREIFDVLEVIAKDTALIPEIGEKIDTLADTLGEIRKSLSKVDLPDGFQVLVHVPAPVEQDEKADRKPKKYGEYLSSENLPYISRNTFSREPGVSAAFYTEDYIVRNLVDSPNDRFDGCIISGQGGIGKTRLMFELGHLMAGEGWQVIRVQPGDWSFDKLKKYLESAPRKYLLLFDYIEESAFFSAKLASDLMNGISGLTVKVLANCRETYRGSSKFPEEHYFLDINLEQNAAEERKYQNFIIKGIIGGISIKFDYKYQDFFILKPSFAVFLRFLHENFPIGEDRELTQIPASLGFNVWLRKRLALTLGTSDFIKIEENVLRVFALLPADGETLDALYDSNLGTYLSALTEDGWIEYTDNQTLRPIHDTIADEVLISHLKRKKALLDSELRVIFKMAVTNGLVNSFIRSMERIVEQEFMRDKSDFFFKMLDQSIRDKSIDLKSVNYIIGVTSLLTEPDRIQLLSTHVDFFAPYIQSMTYVYSLGFAMAKLSKVKENAKYEPALKILFDTWYEANPSFTDDAKLSANILSRSIKFFGINDFAKNFAIDYLQKHAEKKSASYVIQTWLDANGDTTVIAKYVYQYLWKNADDPIVGFVLLPWLELNGNPAAVQRYVRQYLLAHAGEKQASFMLQAWLDKDGDPDFIWPFVDKYLRDRYREDAAPFLLSAWMNRTGKHQLVAKYVTESLKYQTEQRFANPLLQSWLKCGGSPEMVETAVVLYLQKYCNLLDTGYVIKAWLSKGGRQEPVKEHILAYLRQFSQDFQMLQQVVDCVKEPEEIAGYFHAYLNAHSEDSNARAVILVWLKNKWSPETILPYVKRHLEVHAETDEASFVIKPWLDAGGNPDEIEAPFRRFVGSHKGTENMRFTIQDWLNHGGNPEAVEACVVDHLTWYGNTIDARHVLSAWLQKGSKPALILPYIKTYIEIYIDQRSTSYVIAEWLKTGVQNVDIEKIISKSKSGGTDQQQWSNAMNALREAKGRNSEAIWEQVKHLIERHTGDWSVHHRIQDWFKHEGRVQLVEPSADVFLEQHVGNANCHYILQEWLNRRGNPDLYVKHVTRYLDLHLDKASSQYVLSAWLKSPGDKTLINPYFRKFLEIHPDKLIVGYLTCDWLKTGGELEGLEPYIVHFLTLHKLDTDLNNTLIDMWLTRGGDYRKIQSDIESNLNGGIDKRSTKHALQAYINKLEDIQPIEEFAIRFMANHMDHELTVREVLATWLRKATDLAAIQGVVMDYLRAHSLWIESYKIMTSWLDRTAMPEPIETFVTGYLGLHAERIHSSYLIKGWLKAEGRLDAIEEHVLRYFALHGDTDEALKLRELWAARTDDLAG
ncbi:hypothetical protein [Dyadobacter sp. CY323]|uniref:hypothetical protein n=1 Tax=Dyadobacter sp. CY323 TaxID=2907302 RepID=UPI001F24AE9D|nr:hypothetical protein [Dyadobacter sp. CY323]MCE6987971.1 hypothetical protein [Dyadobacter sp. CY323]